MCNAKNIVFSTAVPQNGKESLIDRPARKEALGEIDKNKLNNPAKLVGKPNDKFVNAVIKKEDSKKQRFTDEPIELGSDYAANCNRHCHMDPSVLSAEYAFKDFDMERAIENAKNIDDFAGEKEMIDRRIKQSIAEEKATVYTDFFKKFEKEDEFQCLLNDVNDLLVLPSDEPSPKKVKQKFQIFQDDDGLPDFVPLPKRNKRAFALRRL